MDDNVWIFLWVVFIVCVTITTCALSNDYKERVLQLTEKGYVQTTLAGSATVHWVLPK